MKKGRVDCKGDVCHGLVVLGPNKSDFDVVRSVLIVEEQPRSKENFELPVVDDVAETQSSGASCLID